MTPPTSPSPVILITGAARGLGAALAVILAKRGARLALVGLESDELARTAAECDRVRHPTPAAPAPASPHPATLTWHADVTDRARMTEVADQVRAHFGRIDVVVANAGIALGGPTVEADQGAFDRVIEVNLLGSIATARAFLPALIESKGYLLQIASLAAIAPAPLMAAYCASKSGVEAFAHCLRAEVAHQGVQVGVAYLTWTDTDMVRAADEDPVLKEMRARLPWPANKTAPLEPAADRIANGIAGRKAHVYAQPWIRPLQWLPRAAIPQVVATRGKREVARLAPRLQATSHLRQRPLGPGGAAAATPHQPPAPPAAAQATPPAPPVAPDPHENQVANHPPA
jgi:NAD(P)-dependent dehydrogenase (short-subunit alcohol dehydrogenase family)